MSDLGGAVARIEKRLARYEEGLRVGSFEVGDNPLSDAHAADLRVLLNAIAAAARHGGDVKQAPAPLSGAVGSEADETPKGQHHGQ